MPANPATNPATGITTLKSSHSVDQTVRRLEDLLREKGIKLFATVDHAAEAQSVGLALPPTKVLIFGNPKAGTPLMVASPGIALDLPLKILVSEDSAGGVSVSYNSPAYLQNRHGFPLELMPNISAVEALAQRAAESSGAGANAAGPA